MLMNADSTPPRMPCWLGVQNSSGSIPPEMPRYTLAALVSLATLTLFTRCAF